jgi:hypothetical protein
MKGDVLFHILAKLSGWTGRKAWTGPGNTTIYNCTYISQTDGRNTIYFTSMGN